LRDRYLAFRARSLADISSLSMMMEAIYAPWAALDGATSRAEAEGLCAQIMGDLGRDLRTSR
jgi:hypothetical protein